MNGSIESSLKVIYCDENNCGKEYEFGCKTCGGDFCQDHINAHYCGGDE